MLHRHYVHVCPPLQGGGRFLLISFDPTRTRIERLSVDDAVARPVEACPNCFVLERELDGKPIELVTESTGLPPVLVRSPTVIQDARTEEQAVRVAQRERADQLRAELVARRIECAGVETRRRFQRFFVAFDALTVAELLRHVADGRIAVGPDLADVFRIELDAERAHVLAGRIDELLRQIPLQFRDAAFLVGLRLHAPLDKLPTGGGPCIDRASLYDVETVAEVARHVLAIFATEFDPPTLEPAEARALDPELVEAFVAFANGHLRFHGRADKSIANGEPNGGMFLAFAEFACAARANTDLTEAERATWELLFRLFVPLQEVFLARYGPRTAPHTLDRYDGVLYPRPPAPPIPDDLVGELLACYAKRSNEELVDRHLEHVYWINRDHDEVMTGLRAARKG